MQGYAQAKGMDFCKAFPLVAHLEAIRLLLGLTCIRKVKLHQMGVKSAFLNCFLNKEVYVAQLKGSMDPTNPNYVYKLNKDLNDLK